MKCKRKIKALPFYTEKSTSHLRWHYTTKAKTTKTLTKLNSARASFQVQCINFCEITHIGVLKYSLIMAMKKLILLYGCRFHT